MLLVIFLRLSSDPMNSCSVLMTFKLNLFARSQCFILDRSAFADCTMSFNDVHEVVKLVSSAYILGVENRKLFGKSLMQIRNNFVDDLLNKI